MAQYKDIDFIRVFWIQDKLTALISLLEKYGEDAALSEGIKVALKELHNEFDELILAHRTAYTRTAS